MGVSGMTLGRRNDILDGWVERFWREQGLAEP